MKYLCTSCNYVYDNALWDSEESVNIWAEINECPVCGEYDSFQWIEEEINYIDDDLWPLEIDHFPDIEVIWDKIKVTVWNEIHPMWEAHRIAAVYLYDEYWDLVSTRYLELETEAVVEFDNENFDEFEIRVKCSVHWLWWRKIII